MHGVKHCQNRALATEILQKQKSNSSQWYIKESLVLRKVHGHRCNTWSRKRIMDCDSAGITAHSTHGQFRTSIQRHSSRILLGLCTDAEAIATANHFRNRCITRSLDSGTPYEKWTGRCPDVRHLRIFGYKVEFLDKTPNKDKLRTRL